MTVADSSPVATRPGRAQPDDFPRQGTQNGPATLDLVGRTNELDALGSAFDVANDGRAVAVLIGGDAGIGKSRLVEEFSDRARLRGAVVATGMCVPVDGGLPYAPVVGILRTIDASLGNPASVHQLLHSWDGGGAPISATKGREQSAAPGAGGGEFAKTVFFESVLQTLVEHSQKAPVVLVFEDLHWVDSGSSQLFDFLVRNLGDARVLTLGTYRSDELPNDHALTMWLAELGRHARVRQLALGPLDRSDLTTLMAGTLGEPPAAALVESVYARSQGNPFFAEELLAGGDAAALPTALRSVITKRVKQLPEQSQHVLSYVAAAGTAVDHRLLAAVSALDADTLDDAITAAVDKKVLLIDETAAGYRFRHALIREALYDELLPARRGRLHRDIAAALTADASLGSRTPRYRIAELASHWWASGDLAASLEPSLQAADAAIAVFAYPEAMVFLEHALLTDELVPAATTAAGTTRAALLEKASDVAYFAGLNARAVELAQAAIAVLDADRDRTDLARCYTMLGRNMWGVNDSGSAFEAYEKAVEILPADQPSIELAWVLAEQARGQMLMSHWAAGEKFAHQAIAVARALGARHVEGHALNTLGCCVASVGFGDKGIELLQESLAIAEDVGNHDDLNRAYNNLSSMLIDYGRLTDAASVMFDSAAIGEELWGAKLSGAAGNGVFALVRLGRYAEALALLAELGTHSLGVCAAGPWALPAPVMLRQGRFDVAEQMLVTAQEMTALLGDVQQAASALGLVAELELERDRPDDAIAPIEEALALTIKTDDDVWLPELCALGARARADQYEAARMHGRSVDVDALRRRGDELVALVHATIVARETRGATQMVRNLACDVQTMAERSRLDQSDPDLWGEAARRWAVACEPYPEAYCWWREAEAVLESRAGRARAAEALNRAWLLSRELSAGPLAARIVRLAQRGRLELVDEAAAEPSADVRAAADLGLTAREVEILGQLAAGRSDREIGEALFISKKTVSVHVSNVLRKLSVAGRVEAGKIGQAHGLGSPAG